MGLSVRPAWAPTIGCKSRAGAGERLPLPEGSGARGDAGSEGSRRQTPVRGTRTRLEAVPVGRCCRTSRSPKPPRAGAVNTGGCTGGRSAFLPGEVCRPVGGSRQPAPQGGAEPEEVSRGRSVRLTASWANGLKSRRTVAQAGSVAKGGANPSLGPPRRTGQGVSREGESEGLAAKLRPVIEG